jgi:hypothetical protein
MKLTNIAFTRNRPLQLEGYLESFCRFAQKENMTTYILYKEDLFAAQYEVVFQKFNYCQVVRERDFNRDFLEILRQVETEYVNFGTDDVVYFDSVDLDVIDATFNNYEKEIFGFSLRMDPQSIQEQHICLYKIMEQNTYSVKWKKAKDKTARYPFELNGTVYKTELVREIVSHVSSDKIILKKIFNKESLLVAILGKIFSMKNFLSLLNSFHNPNSLEGNCYRWIKTHKGKYPNQLFFQKICCAALQVNIVNTEVNNPVDGGDEYTVEFLNEKFKKGYRLDIDFLKKNRPDRTHVGQASFRLK